MHHPTYKEIIREEGMSPVWTLFFIGTTAVCALGWLTNHIAASSLVYYMKIKGYKPPTEEETKACTRHVVFKLFKKGKS